MHDEGLIFRIAPADKRQRSGIQALLARLHTAAVVYNQSKAYRNIFVFEDGHLLLRLIFKDAEIVLLQVSNGMILLIGDTDVQLSEIDVHIQLESVFILCPYK